MIKITQKGNFNKLTTYLNKKKDNYKKIDFDYYGREGVDLLSKNTPVRTGLTSNSWYYEIERNEDSIVISFNNSNINKGVNIAIILQYGHGTKNGGWVDGIDYINPAMQTVFEELADKAWKEMIK